MSINIYDPILKKLTPVAGNNEATVASLDALSNVNISSPTEGQIIKFDEINNIWVNVNDDNAPMELGELSNVNLLSVSNGQIIKYDATAEEWINADPQIIESVEDIPDVELTNLADGEFLVYDSLSEKWINTSLSGGYGIKISDGVISSKCFVGTTAEWGALSPIEQNEYTFVNLTDDYDEAREIDIAYVKELPLEGSIQDKFYGLLSYEKKNKVVADGFLDDDQNFIKTTTEDGYIYTSDVVDASVNDIDYVELTSLEYDGTKFILNGETDMAIGDTFYWKEVSDAVFYGGDSATQTFHTIEKTLVVDSVPTEGSNNPVASDGVYTALQTKADTSSLSLVATSGESGDVSYSHSTSGLASDNVQDAIDELADEKIDATDVSSVGKASYVQIDSINNQDVLQYDLSANKWKNSTALKDLAKSTNVLGAKNLLPFKLADIIANNTAGTWNGNVYSLNGIDFTFNSDGTVDASGTATETASVHYYDPVGLPPFGGDRILRLTGCPSGGGRGTTYKLMAYRAGAVDGSTGTAEDYGDGFSLKWLNDGSGVKAFVSISVYTGAGTIDITFKPMLRLSTDTDNTFAPYAKTNQELTEETTTLLDTIRNNGAVNLLENSASSYTDPRGEVTWTVNSDGTVTAVVNQTTTETRRLGGVFSASRVNALIEKFGSLKLTGSPSNRIDVYCKYSDDTYITDDGTGTIIDTTHGTVAQELKIQVKPNTTPQTFVIKPMLSEPSLNLSYGDYVPYAKSNKELTEDVESIEAEMARGGGYVYPITSYFKHIAITTSGHTGQFMKLITTSDEIRALTSSSAINANLMSQQKVIRNNSNASSTWTYSIDGFTLNLNCTSDAIGFIISNFPLTFTIDATSTPEANTMDILNLALLSNS